MNENGLVLIGAKQMAQILDVPKTWLYARARGGDIPHYRLGKYLKFQLEDVMVWLQKQSGTKDRECHVD